MKYFFLFATLLFITGTACKKSKKPEPLDLLPGNWELKTESKRTEPGSTLFRFRIDKSFTRTANGNVISGIFDAHYVNDQKAIEMILTTDQGNVADIFLLEMVSAHEFRYGKFAPGPGPSEQQILLRTK